MAKKPVVLLVHGMGSHAAPTQQKKIGAFGSQFVTAADKALHRYPSHADKSITDYVDLVEFNYDVFFDKLRKKMAENASMRSRIDGVANLAGGNFLESLVGNLTAWEQRFGDDKFFYTHWLDVIFYSTFIGGKIRVELALMLAGLIKEYGNKNVHIVAHSLGTAVVCDTLNLMYRPEHDPNDLIPDLSPVNDQVQSLWMVSNVSRLVSLAARMTDPLGPDTTVKPGNGGCTKLFFNVRHQLDPFTRPARFDPDNDGSWLTTLTYRLCYAAILTDLVIDGNTHSFGQYIECPDISVPLFKQLFKFKATEKQLVEAVEEFTSQTIQGAFIAVKEEVGDLKVTDSASFDDFFEAARRLQAAIKRVSSSL